MSNDSVLIMLQFGTNVGYAIAPLETTFYNMARKLGFSNENIHFSYKETVKGKPESLPDSFSNVIAFDPRSEDQQRIKDLAKYISENHIKYVFGFDLPAKRPFYKPIREAGVKRIVSYYGAPMSSINRGLKLLLKKIEMKLNSLGPDHYIFESNAMRDTAILGRGVASEKTSVVPLGVDVEKYDVNVHDGIDIHQEFDIPKDRKTIFYSGHMQKRKGVHILVDAVAELCNSRNRQDIHLLIFGNKPGEIDWLEERFKGSAAENYITFGGYRSDLNQIMPQCYLGAIASNGWDSFPRSAIEMQACGLPLLVSRFQGLVETIEENKTGLLFTPGDAHDLADKIEKMCDDEDLRAQLSTNARIRVEAGYTLKVQLENISNVVKNQFQ